MQPESIAEAVVDVKVAEPAKLGANGKDGTTILFKRSESDCDSPASDRPLQNGSTQGFFPAPKTDKPRPHVCGTCSRSFARLEHLKRHERSHTKEKPFECPECTRCFARRDLLLRHQQKLHMTNTTSSRSRSARRESVGGASLAGGRVRKPSVANSGNNGTSTSAAPRPRANTISHIDLSSMGLADAPLSGLNRMNALGLAGHNMNGSMGLTGFDFRGMSNALGNHGNFHGLPKLDTDLNHVDVVSSLRTAPPQASFGGFDIDTLFSPGTTVNPAQLHFESSGSMSASQPNLGALDTFNMHSGMDGSIGADNFTWMRNWNMQLLYGGHESAIEESSPSRMSSGDSPPDFVDSLANSTAGIPIQNNNFRWPPSDGTSQPPNGAASFHLDGLSSGLPNLDSPQGGTLSPSILHDPTPTGDTYFHQAMMQQQQQQQHQLQFQQQHQQQHPLVSQSRNSFSQPKSMTPDMIQNQSAGLLAPSMSNLSATSPSIMSNSSVAGSMRHSSTTTNTTLSITDATRQALLFALGRATAGGAGGRKYAAPPVSSPLSSATRSPVPGPSLPSTPDIKKYVDAFIQYAHPHLPVTHIPTLSFDPLDFVISKGAAACNAVENGVLIGGGCLILGMAAIGALYEYEHPASKELFEAAKKMISLYLEERRKVDMSAAIGGAKPASEHQAPLWLVQAMLLTVIYGQMCGDKTSADIASTHCAALVSLARAAALASPTANPNPMEEQVLHNNAPLMDIEMMDDGIVPGDSISRHQSQETDLHASWTAWKIAEERKRTLFAIFIISSLLTTAYNQNPTIMNSEILLDLPCDEELYSAESAQRWQELGGLAAAEHNGISFASALSTLLTANQRQGKNFTSGGFPKGNAFQTLDSFSDDLRPSTFGCLVLINALHNYIWETRSRHHGRQWTAQETESMFLHIEPALNAWQAAWKANEQHRLERPNPFGLGPLAADSIPLLDQAFVRLFVNLGRAKEAFWQRDFDAMADELARGAEIVQHASGSPSVDSEGAKRRGSASKSPPGGQQRRQSLAPPSEQASSKRERHLRKAAFYAADSLAVACSYNLTYTDPMAHELPIQTAMCFFDCCSVLAEWACTIQERVGRYLGVLGRDPVDFAAVPAIMLLENEDIELLRKVETICNSLEQKRFQQNHLFNMNLDDNSRAAGANPTTAIPPENFDLAAFGYGSKILHTMAMMLEKCVEWPITHVMAKALRVQASHMDQRSDASTVG